MQEIIRVSDVEKYYGNGDQVTKAVDRVSFAVQQGEFIGVMGASGSGKSTLLNLVGGLDVPTRGEIIIRKHNIASLKRKELTIFRRRNIGFVFQQYNLIPSLSIRENIVLPMRLDGKEIDIDFFNEIVEILGLKDKLERFPSTLSGGQQQRVSIARALLTKPAIVLADEPTGNLDSVTSMEVVGLLKSCAARFHQTTLIVTHQEEVAQMADRVIRMSDGKIYTRDCNDC